jgi:hypothetical protein
LAPLLTPGRIWIARGLALLVDFAQVALLPAELTPLNNAVDVGTALTMVGLVGWHWAFLPTFLAELVPFVDLVPTWTLAVLVATRGRMAPTPPVVTVEPPPAEAPAPPPPALPPADQAPRDGSGS